MERTKQITIGDAEYQIGSLTATTGSWIVAQIATKMLPALFETSLSEEAGAQLSSARSMLSEDEFQNLQGHALSVCRRMEKNGLPMPVMHTSKRFAIKELEYDLVTVLRLTCESLVFNLTPFFEGAGLDQLLAMLPEGLVQSLSASRT